MGKFKGLLVLATVLLMLGTGALANLEAAPIELPICVTSDPVWKGSIGWQYPQDTIVIPDSSSRDTTDWIYTGEDAGYLHEWFSVRGDTSWTVTGAVDSTNFFYRQELAFKLDDLYMIVYSVLDSSKANLAYDDILDSIYVPEDAYLRLIYYSQLADEDTFVVFGMIE